ncbi:MAG TPA: hypothetical protein EYP85_05080, partial [Armatimonadetes bacterium]|nr:hypothetical protein [Armatimonadota bacterium]
GRRLSAVPELYDRRLKVGFGVWLDYNWRGIGWRPEEPSKNHFTPEEISHALHNALYASDCYVWLYSEQVNWWTGKGLTPAYIEAVRRCRRDMGLWWRPAPRPQPQPKPQAMLHAKDQPGYDDQTTFGPLWAKYEPVLDLPKTWLFRPDPRRVGEREQWFAPGLDTSAWREIQIGEWWEPQGVAYDGVAWYRVTFTPPAEVAGRRVFLAFGAVDESAWVYLNGQLVGQHDRGEDGWDQRFEIEVTDALRPGRENLLAVRVLDRVAYGGIWKSVKLIAAK